MALRLQNPGDLVTRDASFWTPATSWTLFTWFKYVTSPDGSHTATVRVAGDDTYAGSYIWLGSTLGELKIYAQIQDGSGSSVFTENDDTSLVPVNTSLWCAVVFDAVGQTLSLFVGTAGAVLFMNQTDTSGVDMASLTPFTIERMGNDEALSAPVTAIEYERTWQAALSQPELLIESTTVTPSRIASLVSASRLAASGDLRDQANGHDWTLVGAAVYADGLLPPPNTTPLTATTVALPYVIITDVQDAPEGAVVPDGDSHAYHATWWKVTAPSGSPMQLAFVSNADGDITLLHPRMSIWTGDPSALVQWTPNNNLMTTDLRGETQVPTPPGGVFYIQITTDEDTLVESQVVLRVQAAPQLTPIPSGSYAVPDGDALFPLGLVSPSTGVPISYVTFPSCVCGTVLPNGISAVVASDPTDTTRATGLNIYDTTYTLLKIVSAIAAVNWKALSPIASVAPNLFYVAVGDGTNARTLSKVNTEGTVLQSWSLSLSSVAMMTLAVNGAGTIAYYATYGLGTSPIYAYDLMNSVDLPNLISPVASTYVRGLLITAAGDLLVLRQNTALNQAVVTRHHTDGSIQATYTIGPTVQIPSMALGTDDPISCVVRTSPVDGNSSQFTIVKLLDGTTTISPPTPTMEEGIGLSPSDAVAFGIALEAA